MLLAIDIGNTNITVGMFKDDELKATWRIATGVHRMPDEYAVILLNLLRHGGVDVADVTKGAVSCVVPPLLTTFNELFEKYFNIQPLVVGPGVKTGIRIRMDNPREVGGDRISNTAGALSLYSGPIIVVAMGTATAFDTISREGDYLGLYTHTAALPRVELVPPKRAIGTNTLTAMQSGIIFGYAGLIDGIVTRIQEELGEKGTVVATGGYASIIARETRTINHVNPDLTLIGIKTIHAMNQA